MMMMIYCWPAPCMRKHQSPHTKRLQRCSQASRFVPHKKFCGSQNLIYNGTFKNTPLKLYFLKMQSQDSWISSSFGDFGDFGSKSSSKTSAKAIPPKTQDKQPRKRAKTSGPSQASFPKPFEGECELFKKKDSAQSSGDLWADKYQPACQVRMSSLFEIYLFWIKYCWSMDTNLIQKICFFHRLI